MNKNLKLIGYPLFIFFITLVFAYYLFPSEKVASYIKVNLNKANPDLSIIINNIKPSFPPGLKLIDVSLYDKNDLLFKSEEIKIVPGLFSMAKKKKKFYFKSKAFGGVVKGNGFVSGDTSGGVVNIDADFKDILIDEIPAVQNFSGFHITGSVDGKVLYKNESKSGDTLNSFFNLTGCRVEFAPDFFKLEDGLIFDYIKGELSFSNRRLEIEKCDLNGPQENGTITGSVIVNDPASMSILDINGTIGPEGSFLSNVGMGVPLGIFLKGKSGEKSIPFRIYGTFDKPGFSLN